VAGLEIAGVGGTSSELDSASDAVPDSAGEVVAAPVTPTSCDSGLLVHDAANATSRNDNALGLQFGAHRDNIVVSYSTFVRRANRTHRGSCRLKTRRCAGRTRIVGAGEESRAAARRVRDMDQRDAVMSLVPVTRAAISGIWPAPEQNAARRGAIRGVPCVAEAGRPMAAVSRISSHKALVAKSGVGPTDAELVVDALAGHPGQP
jgi:hypothetical protein